MTTGSDLPSSVQLPVWLSRAGADVLKTTRSSPSTAAAWACRARSTAATYSTARRCSTRHSSSPATTPSPTSPPSPDRHHQLHRHHRARRFGLRQHARRRGHRAAAQHLGRARARAARHRQRRPGGAGLRRLASRARSPGWCSTRRCRWASPPRPPPSNASRASRRRWTHSPRSALATNCPLAPDPKGAVDALLAAARAGNGPGGASVATVADAISTALAYPRGDRVDADQRAWPPRVAAARSGDTNQLTNLINRADDAAPDRRPVRQLAAATR